MLKIIKRWLGWQGSSSFDQDSPSARYRPTSATASVLSNGPKARSAAPMPPPPPMLQQGKNAALSLEGDKAVPGKSVAFDPYNTGKFDRSESWERISRSQR
jgi:hypothetical protein